MGKKSFEKQSNFSSGEISPKLYGQSEDPIYQTGLKTARNCILVPQKGIEKRPGSKFLGFVKNSDNPVRLIPFQLNEFQTIILELGQEYCRFWYNGGLIADDAGDILEVTTPYQTEWLQDITFVQNYNTIYFAYINYPPQMLTNNGSGLTDWTWDNFVLSTEPADGSLDFSVTQSIAPSGVQLPTSFSDGILGKYGCNIIINTGANTARIGVHTSPEPAHVFNNNQYGTTLFLDGDIGRTIVEVGGAGRATINSLYYPASDGDPDTIADFPDPTAVGYYGANITITTPFGNTSLDGRQYTIIGENVDATLTMTKLSQRYNGNAAVKLEFDKPTLRTTNPFGDPAYGGTNPYRSADEYDAYDGIGANLFSSLSVWIYFDGNTSVSGASGGLLKLNQWQPTNGRSWQEIVNNLILGINPTSSDFQLVAEIIIPLNDYSATTDFQIIYSTNSYTNVINTYNSGTLAITTNTDTYINCPAIVSLYQSRLIFACTYVLPQTIWMSAVNTFDVFALGSGNDADPIEIDISADRPTAIRWVASTRKLLVGTTNSEWELGSSAGGTGTGAAVTPDSIYSIKRSSYGSVLQQPVYLDTETAYIQASSTKLLTAQYQWMVDGYLSNEFSLNSEHLFSNGVSELCYKLVPNYNIFVLRNDGSILCGLYNSQFKLNGWSVWTTQGNYEQIVTGRSGNTDQLYAVVNRTINGQSQRTLEVFDESLSSQYFDCYSTVAPNGGTLISNILQFENTTVKAIGKNSNTAYLGILDDIELDNSGAATIPESMQTVTLGLSYDCQIETLPKDLVGQGQSLLGQPVRWSKTQLQVYNSYVPTINGYGPSTRTTGVAAGSGTGPYSGLLEYGAPQTNSVIIEDSSGFPINISGIIGEIEYL